MPKGTEDHVGFFVPQSKHTYAGSVVSMTIQFGSLTLFAGFVLSFSNSFCDWAFVAELIFRRR